MYFFFFFQAEDGIRDYKVTGVQTCALPISARWLVERFVGELESAPVHGHERPRAQIGRASCRERGVDLGGRRIIKKKKKKKRKINTQNKKKKKRKITIDKNTSNK